MGRLVNTLALVTLAAILSSVSPVDSRAEDSDTLFGSEGGESFLGPETDWAFLDSYLATWDRFARGENGLAKVLRRDVRRFNAELARAIRRDPSRAMGLGVMYPLLHVGGFVPLDSAVGKRLTEVFGQHPPRVTQVRGKRYYFAGDLYFWWEEHRKEFGPCQLYEDWRTRSFVKGTVIPWYQKMRTGGASDEK